jgi:hypothetical protein
MTAIRFYLTAGLMLVVGLTLISLFPSESLALLGVGVPAAIIGGMVATFYLSRVFRRQPIPRSRFFRMLIETFFGLILIGVWIGYLSAARVLEKAAADGNPVPFLLPAPPPTISSPISALIIVIVFVGGPIRFALEVWRRRRLATVAGSTDEADLDREDQ